MMMTRERHVIWHHCRRPLDSSRRQVAFALPSRLRDESVTGNLLKKGATLPHADTQRPPTCPVLQGVLFAKLSLPSDLI